MRCVEKVGRGEVVCLRQRRRQRRQSGRGGRIGAAAAAEVASCLGRRRIGRGGLSEAAGEAAAEVDPFPAKRTERRALVMLANHDSGTLGFKFIGRFH